MVKGVQSKEEVRSGRRKRDVRTFTQKYRDFFRDYHYSVLFLIIAIGVWIGAALLASLPFATEFMLLFFAVFVKKYYNFDKLAFNFPFRVPKLAQALDASYPGGKIGQGITYWGNEKSTKEQIYADGSDGRKHGLVLGTTGSGKTELLLGLCTNALIQNSGFIYVDGKGDPALINNIFRLARNIGREDDLLLINFITSGRDFIDKQVDKVTNNINLMDKASSGMLIELIVGLMDDSGTSGDMWKGRAIAFVAALTRPLCYLRDKGFIQLSAETYLDYFEIENLERLVYEPEKIFPGIDAKQYNEVALALRSYIANIPGYNPNLHKEKKRQEQKTIEQHGYITMQLTRIFNDLTYNYAHIFKTDVGDIDFYDVVLNRRLMVTLLPALERAPDTLKMCGKLIVGNIKQMMSGCLGNRIEGQVREIIESRATNAPVPFYIILDEYGYYSVLGFAVAPAQARSLGFSITFSAQDFSSLKKSSAEEADATWENTNLRAVGRLTSGKESETWRRITGAAGEAYVAALSGLDRSTGIMDEKYYSPESIGISRVERLDYDDVAAQEDGEFTFIVGKKEEIHNGGVRVIRGMGFYTQSESPREIRINDLIPVLPPKSEDVPMVRKMVGRVVTALEQPMLARSLSSNTYCPNVTPLNKLSLIHDYCEELSHPRNKQSMAGMYWLLEKFNKPVLFGIGSGELFSEVGRLDSTRIARIHQYIDNILAGVITQEQIQQATTSSEPAHSATTCSGETIPLTDPDEDEIDGSTYAYTAPKSANVVDAYLISTERVIDAYMVFREIELFRNPISYNDADNDMLTGEETGDDACTRDQLRAVQMLTSETNPTRSIRPIGESADKEFEYIQKTIREQTTTENMRSLPDSSLMEVQQMLHQVSFLLNDLDEITRQKIGNLNKK